MKNADGVEIAFIAVITLRCIVGDNGDGEGNEVDGKQESRRVASVLARFMLKLEGEPALKCERRNTG